MKLDKNVKNIREQKNIRSRGSTLSRIPNVCFVVFVPVRKAHIPLRSRCIYTIAMDENIRLHRDRKSRLYARKAQLLLPKIGIKIRE